MRKRRQPGGVPLKRALHRVLICSSHAPMEFFAQTLGNGSSTEQAIRDCENARQSYAAAGDRNNEARTLSDFAGLYYQLGQIDRAESMFREALRMFREIGDIDGITTASSNLGDVFLARGNLASAEHALSDALPGYKEMGDKDGVALTLDDLGEVARRRGELDKALTTLRASQDCSSGS